MEDKIRHLFETEDKLESKFNFKKMLLEGYKFTPKKSKLVIYPFVVLMLLISVLSIVGSIYSSFKTGYGLGLVSFLPAILTLGISILIYVGTADYWYKIEQKGLQNNAFVNSLKTKYPLFKYNSNARQELLKIMQESVASKYFIPRIMFEYYYPTAAIDIAVVDVVRTVSDNLTTGADSQHHFSAIFIQIVNAEFNTIKIQNTKEILYWLTESVKVNLASLSEYHLILNANNDTIILEFDNVISKPENKLALLAYLKIQFSNAMKNQPKDINLEEVKRFYKSNQTVGIKHCFKLFEDAQWNLGKIILFIQKNTIREKFSIDFETMLELRELHLGPVILTYYVYQDQALGVEDTDYFYLHFYIDFEAKKNIYATHDYKENNLASADLFIPLYEQQDIPNFTSKMDVHFSKHIQQLDLEKIDGLYEYLEAFYRAFIIRTT